MLISRKHHREFEPQFVDRHIRNTDDGGKLSPSRSKSRHAVLVAESVACRIEALFARIYFESTKAALVDMTTPGMPTILIVTARKHRYRHHTAWWLALHEVPSEELHMRANHDARPDYEVKRDMLADILCDYQVVHAWDDNPHVLRLWSEHGIPTTTVPGWSERT
jgi:hypothetical protein